jgi:hypothetical protein
MEVQAVEPEQVPEGWAVAQHHPVHSSDLPTQSLTCATTSVFTAEVDVHACLSLWTFIPEGPRGTSTVSRGQEACALWD